MAAIVKRVLMIAFHFPPMRGSSGAQRTLNFCRHLPEHGWTPRVLTVRALAHPQTSPDQLRDIPAGVEVRRTLALDAARHLAIAGRYPSMLAQPDRWASWRWTAIPAARREIATWRPHAVWSTFPIATAHVIGARLQRVSGLPWIADCRDLMTEADFPADADLRARWRRIEEETVRRATRVVFTTEGAASEYARRYGDLPAEHWACIANGFAEEDFLAAEAELPSREPGAHVHLLHSGVLYPSERDPSAFFAALAAMRQAGEVTAADLRVTLRASGHDDRLAAMIAARGIGDLVRLAPAIPYRSALAEMLRADALLILQAANCNRQIPAKLYEYLRAGRPILALTDAAGDTARTLLAGGLDAIAPLDDAAAIRRRLTDFLAAVRAGTARRASPAFAARFSRRAQAAELAQILDQVTV